MDSLVFSKFELKLCVLDFFNEKSDILQSSRHALICCEEITLRTRHSSSSAPNPAFDCPLSITHTHTYRTNLPLCTETDIVCPTSSESGWTSRMAIVTILRVCTSDRCLGKQMYLVHFFIGPSSDCFTWHGSQSVPQKVNLQT